MNNFLSLLDLMENELLASVVFFPQSLEQGARHDIALDDFAYEERKTIWAAICALWDDKKYFSEALLIDEIRQRDPRTFERYLDIFSTNTLRTTEYYWRDVLKAVRDYRKDMDMKMLASKVSEQGMTAHEAYAQFEKIIKEQARPEKAKETTEQVKDFLEVMAERLQGKRRGVLTGLLDLDDILGGLMPQLLYIVAARPAMGKTAIAQQIALYLAEQRENVALVTCEMSSWDTLVRIGARKSGIFPKKIQRAEMLPYEFENLCNRLYELCAMQRLDILEMVGASYQEVIGAVQAREKQYSVVFIDQLQALRFEGKNLVREMGQATSMLRVMANKLNCAVVLLCQLSRQLDRREGAVPVLADLRDSGNIEQDADVVIFIYKRNAKHHDEDSDSKPRFIRVAKNRFGPTGQIAAEFHGATTTFREVKCDDGDYDEN